MGKTISSIMQRSVTPVGMDDTIDKVESTMQAHRVSSVPVGGDGGIVGIITTTDLVRFHASGKDSKSVTAWEICTYKPLHVDPDTPVARVAELMIEHGIHHVVVTDHGTVAGIVSSLDFVKLYLDQCRD